MPNSHSPRRQRNWEQIYAHTTKKGPRRYHREPMETRMRAELRKDHVTRNPFKVHATVFLRIGYEEYPVTRVEQLPVRMKLPRLRRLGNKRDRT